MRFGNRRVMEISDEHIPQARAACWTVRGWNGWLTKEAKCEAPKRRVAVQSPVREETATLCWS